MRTEGERERRAGLAYQVGLIVTGTKGADKSSSISGDDADLFCLDGSVIIV